MNYDELITEFSNWLKQLEDQLVQFQKENKTTNFLRGYAAALKAVLDYLTKKKAPENELR